ncbi:protein regulator of cytokinesis 1 isoform X1 [Tetranychus urticae]|uniref:protein regulator of cytokinesis 1 isoform X1 n=1 Tax=Tetranychus urticae TaxID=32264 RepID=UPI00077BCE36|nr:protein regulator of cytokinesis 1 isoform X1 [Tetranychus urticae]
MKMVSSQKKMIQNLKIMIMMLKKENNRREESCIEDESNLGQLVMERSQEVVNKFMDTMTSLAEKWAYLGLNKNCFEKRLDSILNNFIELCSDAEQWEDTLVGYLEQEKVLMLKNLRNLTKDLALPDYEPPQSGGFMDMLNDIMEKHEELQFIKKERFSKWNELHSHYSSLCNKLGYPEEGHRLSTTLSIPTEAALQELQSNVMELKKTYSKKQKIYIQNKRSILQLSNDLEIEPDSKDVVKYTGHEETSVILSDSFLKDQESFMRSLEKQFVNNEKNKEILMGKLEQLWEKLEVDQYTRNKELNGINGWKPSELVKLTELVEKYEELKKQNMGKFIEKLRTEIVEYWDKVYASQEEKDEFEIYMCEEECIEALLTAHEDELERLKFRYQENRKLFESLDEWQQCWVKYLDLEKKMNDPNRFNNRGGVLLKQEKEKKKTQKDLTRCEKDIRTLAEKWSKENYNAPFMVCGQPVLEFIECQKTHYQVYKDNEKMARQKTKSDADAKSRKLQNGSSKPTPNLLTRTPTKFSANNTPTSGVKSSDVNRRLQSSMKPLSPVNRELRTTRSRLQIHRLGSENRCNSTDRSRRATPCGGSIKSTPNIPSLVYGDCTKNIGLDQLIGEEQFRVSCMENLTSTPLCRQNTSN